MPQTQLYERTLDRLLADEDLRPRVQNLVDAAFDSNEAVELALPSTTARIAEERATRKRHHIPRVFLKAVQVEGFRGIGHQVSLTLSPGPGLTLIVGRNGSGKSSLAEALEVALTGTSERWASRKNKDWAAGWNNIHWSGRPWISAEFYMDGEPETITVRRDWADDNVESSSLTVTKGQKVDTHFDHVGWSEGVSNLPPFLSYNTLGKHLDEGPSKLYDELDKVLGLDELTKVVTRLKDIRSSREQFKKDFKAAREKVEAAIEASSDERAKLAKSHFKPRSIDDAALEALIEGNLEDASTVAAVKRLAHLTLPDQDRASALCAHMADALQHRAELETTHGTQMQDLSLLKAAVQLHKNTHQTQCPVCDSPTLDAHWLAAAEARIAALDQQTRALSDARRAQDEATRQLQQLVSTTFTPAETDLTAFQKFDTAAANAIDRVRTSSTTWRQAPPAAQLIDHVLNHLSAHHDALVDLRQAAQTALGRMESEWRPVRDALRAMLDLHRKAAHVEDEIKDLKDAEDWLKQFETELRNERFEPIKARAQEIWAELRNQSNVALNDVRLEGAGKRRKVALDVTVDDSDASALGVMSQGELHSLLISLLLPRLMLDESPFRFVVIDDPVQAMDPAKVDGLARVLHTTAKTHQVIVLTHDTRLADSVRRLRIPATVYNVARQAKSKISLNLEKSPVRQYLDDAKGLAERGGGFPNEVLRRVVPGLCRGAFEVRFKELAWERLLQDGLNHETIERMIDTAERSRALAQLALLGNRPGDVNKAMRDRWGNEVKRTFDTTVSGAHGDFTGSLPGLIQDTNNALRAMGAK